MQPATHNQPEYTVSEISGAIKNVMEGSFSHVRVRGEITECKYHSNGHVYFTLKDDKANLKATIWKSKIGLLKIKPEDGIEIIATGKITTWNKSSNYQLDISSIEMAGIGAMMALLEKRKQALMALGLFEQSRKKALPFMPLRIGIVTSPTGAVIRDILHRVTDRFPCHVMVWPVRVQGQGAEHEIAAAIRGFNEMPIEMRPELIIVARGGGSLEDLWCFNEEAVVYAVVESVIAVISAVGHETDWTLIDHVADWRAPTPTAAAEIALPVIADWIFTVKDYKTRMRKSAEQLVRQKAVEVNGLGRGLPNLTEILINYTHKLDDRIARLQNALPNLIDKYRLRLAKLQLKPKLLHGDIEKYFEKLKNWGERLTKSQSVMVEKKLAKLESLTKLFDSYNYKNVLRRGFTLVKDKNGKLIKSKFDVKGSFTIEFADGEIGVIDE